MVFFYKTQGKTYICYTETR